MQTEYEPRAIEQEAQRYWETSQTFKAVEDPSREKFYCLSMFPYPSGRLHMGHVRNYTIGDVIARHQRMLGKNVLQPMGWDAFGLPAENAAIKHGIPPSKWTRENIAAMKQQLKRLGFGYDWDRELATCDVDYYRWEQWLFTRLMEKGLSYRATAMVNWDPVDQTVLANEQVIDGRGWRSGALVEKREIEQWFIRITAYAQELLDSIDSLDGWPERVRAMQRNWIGRSEGVHMRFGIAGAEGAASQETLDIFTTRPDTVMGVTYVAVAAEHPLAQRAARDNPELANFIDECRQGGISEAELETMEKKGHRLGIDALHPITGQRVPIFAANFVLMSYGTGAVMAVPAHDQRDWEFAERYGIPKRQVIFAAEGDEVGIDSHAFTDKGLLRDSDPFDGLTSEEAFDAVADWLETHGKGGRQVNFRLRDWGVSRQRYWGCPVPVVRTADGGVRPENELPVRLPEDLVVDGSGSPLKKLPAFSELPNGETRETDTFDTFVESSWYYARYCSPGCDSAMLDERAKYWLPVDQYIGGIEHAVLHLLYARFFHKLLRDEGLVDCDEPFAKLLTQGMVIAETWYREDAEGRRDWFNPSDVEVERDDKGRVVGAVLKADGQPVQFGGIEKMSKSKNNGVDPEAMIERYGVDTVRLYVMFTSPPDQSLEWNDEGVEGAYRFLRRLWVLAATHAEGMRAAGAAERAAGAVPAGSEPAGSDRHAAVDASGAMGAGTSTDVAAQALDDALSDARREVHTALKKALFDYQRQQFNTVVSACMTIVNTLSKLDERAAAQAVRREGLSIALRLLAPIAPHITHHLWRELGLGDDILQAPWPQVDEAALAQDQITYVVQVNGKVRGKIEVPAAAERAEVEAAALANENVQRFIGEATLRKVIVVPNKLVNLVVK
ncbi:leucine--tRNA ligase [Lamprobacter modestohalophilus]|uniref:leucine--tRNA ligase n=1 Tax=Lamprobacter modestohalophilus TaxID=1064514 RepID=UPI002ADED826|nr:leucine--tRNA ligase [Lamprobacter modestohalophilus]MEA1048346.1 leucine--tRNA ligase [Lamprobacter modestohalophilus]